MDSVKNEDNLLTVYKSTLNKRSYCSCNTYQTSWDLGFGVSIETYFQISIKFRGRKVFLKQEMSSVTTALPPFSGLMSQSYTFIDCVCNSIS